MTIAVALGIAHSAHLGQLDKAGEPYLLHPVRVALSLETEEQRIVGLLHDVVEDSEWTLEALREAGFSEAVVEAVALLTKPEGEEYEAYLLRVKRNPLARRVKLADLSDNLRLDRIRLPTQKDLARIERYKRARSFLETD